MDVKKPENAFGTVPAAIRALRRARGRVAALLASVALLGVSLALSGCGTKPVLSVLAGSENRSLEPLLERFEKQHRVRIEMHYLGSVDIMLELQKEEISYDAVWPASSLWVSLGDRQRRVKQLQSIMTSPVVFGVRKSKAEALGLVDRPVYVQELLEPIRTGALRFMMSSATQSNSGASAFLGFLHALLDGAGSIRVEDLRSEALRGDIRDLLSGIHRSSGSSSWLKDLFVASDYDAMVNYEALIIEANQELIARGREPLYVVYPVDGMAIADSPLGFISHGDEEREEAFRELQAFLMSDEAQAELSALGRRTASGAVMGQADLRVFNPAWGIHSDPVLSSFRLPVAEVILEALMLYQSELRKPSFTVYCLDFSESMRGGGGAQLVRALAKLFDPEWAREHLLEVGAEDVSVVIAFSDRLHGQFEITGGDPEDLRRLLEWIGELDPEGFTDVYSPVIAALQRLRAAPELERYMPAIVLMTDGESNTGRRYADLEAAWRDAGLDVPVFGVLFGQALKGQLEPVAELTRGRLFDGRADLAATFRGVRGYN